MNQHEQGRGPFDISMSTPVRLQIGTSTHGSTALTESHLFAKVADQLLPEEWLGALTGQRMLQPACFQAVPWPFCRPVASWHHSS